MRAVVLATAVSCIANASIANEAHAGPPMPERAVKAVNELKLSLKKELEQAMTAGGPDNAISVCKERAPALAEEIGKKHDVLVGRSSHKLRNDKNAPRPWLKPLIDEWRDAKASDRQARALTVRDGVTGYAEPIAMGAVCLACHGDDVAEATRAKIRAAYPSDQATGFKEGDLRGVFWAEQRSSK